MTGLILSLKKNLYTGLIPLFISNMLAVMKLTVHIIWISASKIII